MDDERALEGPVYEMTSAFMLTQDAVNDAIVLVVRVVEIYLYSNLNVGPLSMRLPNAVHYTNSSHMHLYMYIVY